MAQLAIKGHATRGKEVIEILEMLGGKNRYQVTAIRETYVYFVDGDTISSLQINQLLPEQFIVFTLEEFLEKYPYKIGDKVIYHESKAYIKSMRWDGIEIVYKVECNKELWDTTMFYLQPYKEESMEEKLEQITLDIPKGYEFFGINDDNQMVLAKKQPKYPKTYDECCKIISVPIRNSIGGHKWMILQEFQKLLVCLDAYWKIAGEQMGLGKPWEPDWKDETEIYYTISYDGVNIKCYNNTDTYSKLAFPTKEMRDAFKENFDGDIDVCKEFL